LKAIHKPTESIRALKFVSKMLLNQKQIERISSEYKLLRNLDHPNIMKVYETIEND
jgi:calcium-dependent protein kinase